MSPLLPGMPPVGIGLLAARAGLLGAVVLGIGVVSHVAAEGLLPGRLGLGALYVGTAALAALFLRAPASRSRILTLVVGGQLLVHGALSVLAGHRGDRPRAAAYDVPDWRVELARPGPPGSVRDQLADAALVGSGTPGASPGLDPAWWGWPEHLTGHLTGHLIGHAAEAGVGMMVAHTAGAVAVACWLAAGESALWALLALTATVVRAAVHRVLGTPPTPGPCPAPRAAARPDSRRPVRRRCPLHHLVPVRRGPPLLAV